METGIESPLQPKGGFGCARAKRVEVYQQIGFSKAHGRRGAPPVAGEVGLTSPGQQGAGRPCRPPKAHRR